MSISTSWETEQKPIYTNYFKNGYYRENRTQKKDKKLILSREIHFINISYKLNGNTNNVHKTSNYDGLNLRYKSKKKLKRN